MRPKISIFFRDFDFLPSFFFCTNRSAESNGSTRAICEPEREWLPSCKAGFKKVEGSPWQATWISRLLRLKNCFWSKAFASALTRIESHGLYPEDYHIGSAGWPKMTGSILEEISIAAIGYYGMRWTRFPKRRSNFRRLFQLKIDVAFQQPLPVAYRSDI